MLMDKETADAWAEQQTREIKNLKAMQNSERERTKELIHKIKKDMIGLTNTEYLQTSAKDGILDIIDKNYSSYTSKEKNNE